MSNENGQRQQQQQQQQQQLYSNNSHDDNGVWIHFFPFHRDHHRREEARGEDTTVIPGRAATDRERTRADISIGMYCNWIFVR